jgi:hypothetical protein
MNDGRWAADGRKERKERKERERERERKGEKGGWLVSEK